MAHVAVVERPPKLKELRALGLAEWRVPGFSRIPGLVPSAAKQGGGKGRALTATTGAARGSELRVKLISCRL